MHNIMKTIWLDEVDSTNSYIMRDADAIEAPAMVLAHTQTAGRGQRGNSWESEPGMNLTFSVIIRPETVPTIAQFSISEATALGVADSLIQNGIDASVKWANDIYVGDRKICGILIQHSLMGDRIAYSVLGIGINVNQEVFVSNAPNPVSMWQITGKKYSLEALASQVGECLEKRLAMASSPEGRESLHEESRKRLWRCDGKSYPFCDTATQEHFEAMIEDVDPHGPITLRLPDNSTRTYSFKEVTFLL